MAEGARRIRWGILGTGRIAGQFARGLAALDDAELVAVGSRAAQTAAEFADEHGVPHRHASYADLAADPDLDAIYVATPHPFHKGNSLLCLGAGKAVLCEKPFTINAAEAEEVVAAARGQGRFLMEAMWTRFVPAAARVRELLAEGAIGEVRMLRADFGYRAGIDPNGRLFNLALGGGALLDVGVYTVSFASMVFGAQPSQITSATRRSSSAPKAACASTTPSGIPRNSPSRSPARTRSSSSCPTPATATRARRPRWAAASGRASSKAPSCPSTRRSPSCGPWTRSERRGGSAIPPSDRDTAACSMERSPASRSPSRASPWAP
jgi:predicted dehydrogenase